MLVESERLGIEAIEPIAEKIYSIGISSFANAEIAIIERNPNAHIIATTIDEKGLAATVDKINSYKDKIVCKLEDVREPLPYTDAHFDFIYARLVLHYLTKQELKNTLRELRRIMKQHAKIYVVVRSVNEWELQQAGTTTDETTGMTTYYVINHETGKQETRTRRFYSTQSLQEIFEEAGFTISWCKEFEETLCHDFERTKPNARPNILVAMLAEK